MANAQQVFTQKCQPARLISAFTKKAINIQRKNMIIVPSEICRKITRVH